MIKKSLRAYITAGELVFLILPHGEVLVEMINSMEVREDDETFKNAVDYMFDGLERRSPQHFAVRQYKKYKLASGDICSK